MSSADKDSLLSLAELLANTQADELEVKHKLNEPRSHYVNQKTLAINQELEKNYVDLLKYMDAISVILKDQLELLPQAEKEQYALEFMTALERLSLIEKTPQNKEDTWQDILGLSDTTLLWIYTLGYSHYEQKKFSEARSLFQLLVTFNSLVSDYWIALGFAERGLSLEEKALNSFTMALLLNPQNPLPRYQAAEIYIHLGKFDDGLIELDNLTDILSHEEKETLRTDIELLRTKAKNRQTL